VRPDLALFFETERMLLGFMKKVTTTLLAVGFVIFLPLLLPVACILHGVYLRRLHMAADLFKRVACGQILGRKSIQLADAEWAERMQE
jgi:hypothetical protein